ncbi:hypothetical protein [Candidatus Azobacteroides pseudotrichonymphae]|uniref:Uncharacterized protein n=1 Tax=Azobacteroides pseudotrichonymphae genomovar. CFP2 TaxID=511995 RepID=B6YS99_AZOPC|nr:hypothetical protein [Candidatus Azobacteroides pseudotrichonymphae]BAG84071.1 hypothetical protein CFPG_P2-13 [Candidatus Azobacteroides pseudotrichonymphae genomovar. CFP2]
MKYKILLLLSLFTFSAFPKAPRSTTPSKNSHPSLYSIASKLQDEVVSLEAEAQRLIDLWEECISKRNSLINDMDNIIWKIDKGEIAYRNDEIKDIRNRIDNLSYRDKARGQIGNEINKRKLAVECKLEENPKLKNLIYMDRLCDKIREYNNLVDDDNKYDYQMENTNGELWNICNNKTDTFFSKTNNLPYYPTSEDSQEEIEPEPSDEDSEVKSPPGE